MSSKLLKIAYENIRQFLKEEFLYAHVHNTHPHDHIHIAYYHYNSFSWGSSTSVRVFKSNSKLTVLY